MKVFNIFANRKYIRFLSALGVRSIDVYCTNKEVVPMFIYRLGRLPFSVGKIYGNHNDLDLDYLESVMKSTKISYLYYQPFIKRGNGSEKMVKKYLNRGFEYVKNPRYPTKTLFLNKNLYTQAVKSGAIIRNLKKSIDSEDLRIIYKKSNSLSQEDKKNFFNLANKFQSTKSLEQTSHAWQEEFWNSFGKNCELVFVFYKGKPIHVYQFLVFGNDVISYKSFSTKISNKLSITTRVITDFLRRRNNFRFDFFGIADERYPDQYSWKNFTEYKNGFFAHPEKHALYYMQPLVWKSKQAKILIFLRKLFKRPKEVPGLYYEELFDF